MNVWLRTGREASKSNALKLKVQQLSHLFQAQQPCQQCISTKLFSPSTYLDFFLGYVCASYNGILRKNK